MNIEIQDAIAFTHANKKHYIVFLKVTVQVKQNKTSYFSRKIF